ncbi:MAG: SDR family oxidoreductase [Eggerthellaceae bacterium]|nr:SDR family oxidoreductase [Eggerthellaceae bacterium]
MSKVQIVTGGTSGMGLATAIELGKFGPVFVGGRNQARIDKAVEVMKAAGVEGYGYPCDISDVESVKAFAVEAQKIGEIGNVVNAAGVDFEGADETLIIAINMVGVINMTEVFLPLMTEGSTLVNFSSVTGYYHHPLPEETAIWDEPNAPDFAQKVSEMFTKHPNPAPGRLPDDYVSYAGSKNFVMYYTRANATRFGARGLRVISVAPGSYLTPMLEGQAGHYDSIAAGTALKRLGNPEEMAAFVGNLLDPRLGYLTGTDLLMDGGKLAVHTKQLA